MGRAGGFVGRFFVGLGDWLVIGDWLVRFLFLWKTLSKKSQKKSKSLLTIAQKCDIIGVD